MNDQAVVTWDDGALGLEQQLVALAAYGLAGSVRELMPGPLAAHEWFVLLREARARGLVGMLAAAAHDGALKLSTAQAEELAVVEREAAALTLLTEQRALRVSGLLSAADRPHRMLDGPALARLGYRDLALRHGASAIVLAEPEGVRLVEALAPSESAGRTIQVVAQPALRWADVTIELAQLADPPATFTLADQRMPTATLEEHLVLACLDLRSSEVALSPVARSTRTTSPTRTAATDDGIDGAHGPGGPAGAAADPDDLDDPDDLLVQRDVAELALSPAVDADRVRQVAERWQVADHVSRAIVDTWDRFELADRTPLSVWAERREEPVEAPRAVPTARRRRRRGWSRVFARRLS